MKEDIFVEQAMVAAEEILDPPLFIRRGAALLYQVTVNNRLEVTIAPRKPTRGQAAFQTDLCVFERINDEIHIPRVVMEFKLNLSTHDVLTYSSKARKHKQVYPYLRYGIVVSNEKRVPGRFFTHNEGLDFCVAAGSFKTNRVHEILASILRDEVASSRLLEAIAFDKTEAQIYRNEILLRSGLGKIT